MDDAERRRQQENDRYVKLLGIESTPREQQLPAAKIDEAAEDLRRQSEKDRELAKLLGLSSSHSDNSTPGEVGAFEAKQDSQIEAEEETAVRATEEAKELKDIQEHHQLVRTSASLTDELAEVEELEGKHGTYLVGTIVLGSGGFGSVTKGRDVNTGEPVAIKFYKPRVRFDDVENEVAIHSYLNDRNIKGICRFIDGPIVRDTNVGTYVVLEYVDGKTLYNLLSSIADQDEWDESEALEQSKFLFGLMKSLTQTLLEIHNQCVTHYDLKPNNMMVTTAGKLVILDLGLACFQQNCNPATRGVPQDPRFNCYYHRSTKGYNAPEVLARRTNPVSAEDDFYDFRKADVYALGKVFTDITTGIMSFHRGEDFNQRLIDHPEEMYHYFKTGNSRLDELIQVTIFEPDPDVRPSIFEVRNALAAIEITQPFPIFKL